ncbi:MAG: hypothetical protein QXI19_05620 [Candidatus Caldarchaeum sp.]
MTAEEFKELLARYAGEGSVKRLRLRICLASDSPWDLVWWDETENFVRDAFFRGVRKRFREWVRENHPELLRRDEFGRVTGWEFRNLDWAYQWLDLEGGADVDNMFVYFFLFPTNVEILADPGSTEALKSAFEESAKDLCRLLRATARWCWDGGIVWGRGEAANPLFSVYKSEEIASD